MKKDIHPEFIECVISCACGAEYRTMSTAAEIKVDICSSCHPFYTGKQKLIDAAGRVEKFNRKYARKTA